MAAEVTKPRCVIIAGAPQPDAAFIAQTVGENDFVICADRGYAAARQADVAPDLLVGDFDSYSGELPQKGEIITLQPEKDDTDTMHCVTAALERGFTEFVFLAALGGRLDHTLANCCLLEYLAEHNAHGIILSKNEKIELLTVGTHRFTGCKGLTFSVLPFGCDSVTISYCGAKYPLSRGVLHHSNPMGVSNVFISDRAEITVHSGKALLLTEFNV